MGIFEEIREIVSEQLGLQSEEVKPEALFIDDLGADSLDIVELVMALEERFDIEVPDEDAEKMQAVSDVIEYIETKTNRTLAFEDEDEGNRSRS